MVCEGETKLSDELLPICGANLNIETSVFIEMSSLDSLLFIKNKGLLMYLCISQ